MRSLVISSLALLLAACGNGPSQTGAIGGCNGVTLSGSGAFTPLSGTAYQTVAQLGGGQSGPGNFEVVIWGNPGDAGSPTQSNQTICQDLLAGNLSATNLYIAPQTLELALPTPLVTGSDQTTISELTHPYSQTTSELEDIVGNVQVSNVGTLCLEGSFSANLMPVDPTTAMALDGGVATQINGSFSSHCALRIE